MYFNSSNSYNLVSLNPKKGYSSGQSLPYRPTQGNIGTANSYRKKPLVKSPLQIYFPPPPGGLHLEIALKYKGEQSKNGKFSSNYKASPTDFETQISLFR